MSRTFRVRLPEQLDEQLSALCETTQLSLSAAIRESVRYMVAHPELWHEMLSGRPLYALDDARTPAQQEAWLRDKAKLVHVDLGPLLASMRGPGAYPALMPKPVQEIRPMVDPRTPEQREAWERDRGKLEALDLGELVGRPLPGM